MSQLAPQLIGLLGTLLVALIGFYQWRRLNNNPKRTANAEAGRKALEGLWQKLEEINLSLRDELGNPEINAKLREVNAFFLSNSLYFRDEDQSEINAYITALNRLRTAIYDSGDQEVVAAFSRTWAQMPENVDAEIKAAAQQVSRLRTAIKARIIKELGLEQ